MRGFQVVLCRPLTRRLMMGGIPSQAAVGLFLLSMELFMLRLYVMLPLVLVLFLVLRALYASDPWSLFCWLAQARAVLYGRTRLEV